MNKNKSDNNKSYRNKVRQKFSNQYTVGYIPLPPIHPDPLISIKLIKYIYQLVHKHSNNMFDRFKSLETQEQYYLSRYSLEYLFPTSTLCFIYNLLLI